MLQANHDGGREASPFRRDPQVPHDIEAERMVLAGMVGVPFIPELFDEVTRIVAPRDFFRDSHQIVYRTILELHADGQPLDGLLIYDAIRRKPEASTIDDAELMEMLTTSHGSAFADHYARIVRDASLRRDLIEESSRTIRDAYAGIAPADEQVTAAETRFFDIGQRGQGHRGITVREAIEMANTRIEDRRGGMVSGVPTGFKDLDRQIGGCLANGQVTLVAGRPGSGKTALGMGIAENVSKAAASTLFLSMEMSADELGERLISGHAGVPNDRIKRPTMLTDMDVLDLERSSIEMSAYPLFINDRSTWTADEIASEARRQKSARDIRLIVIDYLQLIEADAETRKASRQEQITKISRKVKNLARSLNVPVVALCQLNRESEKRADKRPMLSDLRESGSLEQDADVVLLLHRPEYYDPNDQPGIAECIVAKNRHGETGTVFMHFQGNLTRFRSLAKHERPPVNDGVNF